jgi:hypothetical protein
LYYGVLIQRDPYHITGLEATLIVFFVAFAVDEVSAMRDAGTAFYTADFWSLWDVCIIVIGIAFLVWSKCIWRGPGAPGVVFASFSNWLLGHRGC